MSDALQCTESDEESTVTGPFAQPYSSSYGIASASWELRKNLTDTFNQHVVEKKAPGIKKGNRMDESQPSLITNEVDLFGQKSTRSMAGTSKPPRLPKSSHPSNGTGEKPQGKRCVSVYLRVRPPKDGTGNTIEILPGVPPTKVRTHAPAKSNAAKISRERNSSIFQSAPATVVKEFEFEEVFGFEKQNQDVYARVVAPMVERMFPSTGRKGAVMGPESGLLFAYGATNAGKTYSILGKAPSQKRSGIKADLKHLGIVPRAISDIIEKMSSRVDHQLFELYMSYYEIYNECIYDLLEERNPRNPMYTREPLKLRESQKKNTIIRGLQKRRVKDVEEGFRLARQANAKRQTSSNNLNNDSSRSHCICQLQIIQRESAGVLLQEHQSVASNGYSTEEEASEITRQKPTSIWIVDLAGSERTKRTNVGAIRQREAAMINKSLMNLMRCLSIIGENQSSAPSANHQIIPFRENKLTHLFMPIFTGRSAARISMIVNVNPAAPDFDETSHVLSYASKAKLVQIEDKDASVVSRAKQRGEYGYNGRPLVNGKPMDVKKTTVTAKMLTMLKQLSPKKAMKQSHKQERNGERKRKAAPSVSLPRVASFSSTNSNGSQNLPKMKRTRVTRPNATSNPKTKASTSSKGDMKALKVALSVTQAELEVLKAFKAEIHDNHAQEMEQLESKIRLEVSEEMEAQLEQTKRHYTTIISTMKSQSRQSLGVFEKNAREEKASERIEVLLFKVQEAEEEMVRMSGEHKTEISNLKEQHNQEVSSLQNVIDQLKQQLVNGGNSGNNETILQDQKLRIGELEAELRVLERSKTDIIAAYEQLLTGEDDEEIEDEESDEESPEPAVRQYRTRSSRIKANH